MPALEVRAGLSSLEFLRNEENLEIKVSSFLKCLDLCGSLPCGLRYVLGMGPLVGLIKKMKKNNTGRIIKDGP